MLGFCGMIMGVLQAQVLPQYLGLGHPAIWAITLACGIAVGGAIGALHGSIVAFLKRSRLHRDARRPPGLARRHLVRDKRQTVAPMDATFRLMGGGTEGSIGATASWIVGFSRLYRQSSAPF